MAHRSVVHESTGQSPAKVIGRELWLPVDLLTCEPPEEGLPREASNFARSLEERLEEVQHHFRSSLKFFGDVVKHCFDEKVSHVDFKEGDQV